MHGADATSLERTREFWDANPCGLDENYNDHMAWRYAMEPWLPAILRRIGSKHASVIEIGCGRGVDSMMIAAAMKPGGRFFGIDYSPQSVEVARSNANALATAVVPEYAVGNAESLDFSDGTFEAAYSMGVLHHTPNERAAIKEIHRVLKPGGKAYVFLYRKPAPKVAVAKLLRALQACLDAIFRSDRCIYAMLRSRGPSNRLFGTMFHECFGVPIMKWYWRREILALFGDFTEVELRSIGPNLGRFSPGGDRPSLFGYFWWIEARK